MTRDGIINAKTDIQKAEIYLLGEPGTVLEEDELRTLIEDNFGYGLRSYETTSEADWDELGKG